MLPRVPFQKIKEAVLGKRYILSIALLPPREMKPQMAYRYHKGSPHGVTSKGGKTSNVLSFPLSKTSGEILICPSAGRPYTVEYLFIHGLLHLKGLPHGATMESAEQKLLARFSITKERA